MTERTPSVFEIQAGEGGEDSKLFCEDLAMAYIAYAGRNNCTLENDEWGRGKISLVFVGPKVFDLFFNEGGKHCVQRVPPTEKRGRKQTSIVTVAVTLPATESVAAKLNMSEVNITTKRGSGPGGQHRNKTESCVVARHIPSGLTATIDGRDQHSNKRTALRILAAKLQELENGKAHERAAYAKRQQVGDGGRGDKIRTYNFIKSRAVDHRTGAKTTRVDEVIGRGKFELLK